MDKNSIIGFILIAVVVIGFSIYTQPSKEEIARQQHYRDSLALVQEKQLLLEKEIQDSLDETTLTKKNDVNDFFAQSEFHEVTTDSIVSDTATVDIARIEPKEEIVTLENEFLKIEISTKGAQMVSAELKDYTAYDGSPLYLFDEDAEFSLELENRNSVRLNTIDAYFTPVKTADASIATFRLSYADDQYVDFIYSLTPDDYMIKFDIQAVGMESVLSRANREKFVVNWQQKLRRKEKSIKNEQRYSHIYYKITGQDVKELSNSKNERLEVSEPVKWVAFKDQFFSSAIISDYAFDISVLESKIFESDEYLKRYDATLYIPVSTENDGSLQAGFKFFLGPLKYSMLRNLDKGVKDSNEQLDLDKMVPLGWTLFRWVNQYLVIPLFSLLSGTGLQMGLIIFLLTLIIKILISPLTYKSFMSSAKMRVLRPQVEEINKKYPKQEQAMERQRATMDLYSRAGASPMSGCLPMLLQMPILIALFAFFPSAIELRHQSFLWADDLSTYDSIIEWNANIPLLSSWLGNHLSLFCILMTLTNIVYTRFTMEATNTGQQQMPGMKLMMTVMPVIFLFILNDYPAGLTYYYFLSLLITILLTLTFRWVVNEDKLLAKLEANKMKPKKKSGFMARLEEAQRMQQQQAKAKGKSNKKR